MSNRLGPFQNFGGGELRNWKFQALAAAPSGAAAGQPYYNSGNNGTYIYNGSSWRPTDAALLSDNSIKIAALEVDPRARSTHTGTQAASTIIDLATTVKGYTLDSFAAPVASVSFNNQKATLVATGTLNSDGVNLGQMNAAITAAIQGVTAVKNPVRAVATTNISTLSGLQTVDSVSLVAGDRVLLTAQTNTAQNLIYVVQSGAWTIALDDDNTNEIIEGTQVLVAEGSNYAGTNFRVTTTGTITPGTTNVTWVQTYKQTAYTADSMTLSLVGNQFAARLGYGLTTATAGIQILPKTNGGLQVDASGVSLLIPTGGGLVSDSTGLHLDISSTIAAARITSGQITGDGTTTSFTLTHGLNTRRISVSAQDSSYNYTDLDWSAGTVNSITIVFATPPANGTTYTVVVTG
jgi:hypothetical protein